MNIDHSHIFRQMAESLRHYYGIQAVPEVAHGADYLFALQPCHGRRRGHRWDGMPLCPVPCLPWTGWLWGSTPPPRCVPPGRCNACTWTAARRNSVRRHADRCSYSCTLPCCTNRSTSSSATRPNRRRWRQKPHGSCCETWRTNWQTNSLLSPTTNCSRTPRPKSILPHLFRLRCHRKSGKRWWHRCARKWNPILIPRII